MHLGKEQTAKDTEDQSSPSNWSETFVEETCEFGHTLRYCPKYEFRKHLNLLRVRHLGLSSGPLDQNHHQNKNRE